MAKQIVFAAVLLAATAFVSPSEAKVQGGAATPYAKQVAELHTTVALLEKANHDYKGHRAKAVHEIRHAIHLLHPHHHKSTPAAKAVKGAKGGNNETQATSDDQLRQAIDQLHAVQKELGNGPAHAHAALRAAVHELHTALKIR